MIVEFEDEALAEIENAISYSEGRFGTGERLSREIQSSILRIAEDPFRFRKNHLGVCIHHLPPFPCYLVFEPRKNPARTPQGHPDHQDIRLGKHLPPSQLLEVPHPASSLKFKI